MKETLKHNKHSETATRELLLCAAKSLFSQKGFAGTSVKEIADKAGVNISLVSYHFGGKEALYKHCLEEFAAGKLKFIEGKLTKPTSKEDFRFRLRVFLEELVREELQNKEIGCIVRREIESNDPLIIEIFMSSMGRVFDAFIKYIKQGQSSGYIRKDLDARHISLMLMGGFQHALRTDHLRKKMFNESIEDLKIRNKLIDEILKIFFEGISSPKE